MHITQLTEILTTQFALDVELCRFLPGEVDLNAFVSTTDGNRYVCKLYAASTSSDDLDLQDAALAHLAIAEPGLGAPVLASRHNLNIDGEERVARLLTWVEGVALADLEPSAELLRSIGRTVARTDQALADVEHVALDRR
jgi:hydroxylysine kinase